MNKGWHFPLEFLHLKNSQPLGVGTASCVSGLGFSGHLPAGGKCPERTPLAPPPLNRGHKALLQGSCCQASFRPCPAPQESPQLAPSGPSATPWGSQCGLTPRRDTIQDAFRRPATGAFGSLHFVQPPLDPRPPPSPKPLQCPRTLSPFFELQCSLPLSLGITERAAAGVTVPPDPPLTRLCARPSAGQWLRRARPAFPFQCSQLSHGVSGSQGPGLWQLNADSCPPCLQLWSRPHRCVPRAQAGVLWEPEAVV